MSNRGDRIRDEMNRRSHAWQQQQGGPSSSGGGGGGNATNRPHTPNALVVGGGGSSHNNGVPVPSPFRSGGPFGNNSSNNSGHHHHVDSHNNNREMVAMGGSGGGGSSGGMTVGSSSSGLDGPLPREAREIIAAAVQGDTADQAETYARRLLSTRRRVGVYRQELSAAQEEVTDYKGMLHKSHLVSSAVAGEIQSIDARIEQLMQERRLCEMQLAEEQGRQSRIESKAAEAQQRVEALRGTIDAISGESQRGQLLLRQLVPNLNIDNYA